MQKKSRNAFLFNLLSPFDENRHIVDLYNTSRITLFMFEFAENLWWMVHINQIL